MKTFRAPRNVFNRLGITLGLTLSITLMTSLNLVGCVPQARPEKVVRTKSRNTDDAKNNKMDATKMTALLGQLKLSADSINFEKLPLDVAVKKSIKIENTGKEDVSITLRILKNKDFLFTESRNSCNETPCQINLKGGQAETIEIEFEDKVVGKFEDQLVISLTEAHKTTSNNPTGSEEIVKDRDASNTISVNLSGERIDKSSDSQNSPAKESTDKSSGTSTSAPAAGDASTTPASGTASTSPSAIKTLSINSLSNDLAKKISTLLPYRLKSSETTNSLELLYGSDYNTTPHNHDLGTVSDALVVNIFKTNEFKNLEVLDIKVRLDLSKISSEKDANTDLICLSSAQHQICSGQLLKEEGWAALINPEFFKKVSSPVNTEFTELFASEKSACGSQECITLKADVSLKTLFDLSEAQLNELKKEDSLAISISDDVRVLSSPQLIIDTKGTP
jgi:hypothetical protein